jgi:acetyl esterase/lipase
MTIAAGMFVAMRPVASASCVAFATVIAACSSTTPDGADGAADRAGEAVTAVRDCPLPDASAVAAVRVARDVTYATREGRALQLDVAWTAGGPPAPLIVLLHGGGWSAGSRASLVDEMRALALHGYTAATVEYRLTQAPRNVFPAAFADVRCALRTLRRRADEYNIEPGRAAAVGYSAGGHLASLLGVGLNIPGLDADCGGGDGEDVRVQAVVSFAGPQDLRVSGPYTQEQAELVTNFLGAFPGDRPELAALASPIAHVSGGDPPFLMVHGSNDDLVPVGQSRRMVAALRQVGTPASLLELRGAGHDFVGLAASDNDLVRCTVDAFLTRWLGAR